MIQGAGDGLLDELSALALEAARAAGELLLARPDHLPVDTKSSPTDVVTAMDRRSEELLVSRLLGARPDDGLLGEEGGQRLGTSGVRWVVDPLDGTVNYLYGHPVWAVSVAAEVDGQPAVGVVHCPAVAETYVGVRGRGAWRLAGDGRRALQVGRPPELAAALVGTGFGYTEQRRQSQGRVIGAVLPRVRDVRRVGAASVDLCWVADGRLDAYWEKGLKPWDLAAGQVVATAAGAQVMGLRGMPAGEELVLAAAPGLAGPLHDLLCDLGADED